MQSKLGICHSSRLKKKKNQKCLHACLCEQYIFSLLLLAILSFPTLLKNVDTSKLQWPVLQRDRLLHNTVCQVASYSWHSLSHTDWGHLVNVHSAYTKGSEGVWYKGLKVIFVTGLLQTKNTWTKHPKNIHLPEKNKTNNLFSQPGCCSN